MSRPSAYPWELRERDVRMVAEFRPKHESEYAAIVVVTKKLGIGTPETVHKWIRRAEIERNGEESTPSSASGTQTSLFSDVADGPGLNSLDDG